MPKRRSVEQGPALVPFHAYAKVAREADALSKQVEELDRLASHDQLTGTLNRHGAHKYLESASAPKAMLLIDADYFKEINDNYGYDIGDQVLIDIFSLLRASVRPTDIIVRWGGDEFLVILNGETEEPQPAIESTSVEDERRDSKARHIDYIAEAEHRISGRVGEFLRDRFELQQVNFNLSVGGIKWPGSQVDIADLVVQAQEEMKADKDKHRLESQYR